MKNALLVVFGFLLGCPSAPVDPPLAVDPCATPVVSWDGSALRLDAPGCASVALEARVLGDGEWTVDFRAEDGGWVPHIETSTGGTFRGLVLEGPWSAVGDSEPVLWRQGYQSWSFAGVLALEPLEVDPFGVPIVGGDGDATSVAAEEVGTSWWVGLVGRDGGSSLLLGAQGAKTTRFFTAFDESTAWAVWGHRGDDITVTPGGSLVFDPLLIDAGSDPFALHTDYAADVARRQPPRVLQGQPITGWATWYEFFEDVTEADVRANLAVATEMRDSGEGDLEVFQIDDGWQQVWGDWTADAGFPSGMQGLASDIAAAGFVPGLWMAPMYVDRSTSTWLDNPDWWVRDLDGDQLRFTNLNTGDYAVIDVTHPAAAQWLGQQIADRVAEGWTYLKLDFLYAAAEVGLRQEPITGVEAYHRALEIFREAAGEDTWLLLCGAPFLPSVGYAESYRSGADIAFSFDGRPQRGYLRWQVRSTAARSWTNGSWWWMDADQILVRDPFDDSDATGSIVGNAVSGGVWMLGDDLATVDPERRALAMTAGVVELRGDAPIPISPLAAVSGLDASPVVEQFAQDDTVPSVWHFADGAVALLNLAEDPITVEGPGGTELLSGETASAGSRMLLPGAGEVWAP